jgi:hypothetical protein
MALVVILHERARSKSFIVNAGTFMESYRVAFGVENGL